MPTLFRMSDEKQFAEGPTVVIAETTSPAKPRKTKKYVIIAVSAILSAAIILAAILVGMYMFTQAQKDILKYTLNFNANSKQDVTSDPNTNIVQYHVSSPGQETWIVNDFNKDIQVVKIQTTTETNCYANALNRTNAMDPSKIATPESNDIKGSVSLIYTTSNTPISDTSFLSKAARDMCSGTSIYWVYPQCSDQTSPYPNNTVLSPRNKRQLTGPPYSYVCSRYGYYCVAGCCKIVCACAVKYQWSVCNNQIECTWYTYDCNGNSAVPVNTYACNGPSGLPCSTNFPTCTSYCTSFYG